MIKRLQALGASRLIILGVVSLGLILFSGFVIRQMLASPMSLLYDNLNQYDATQITDHLDKLQIPYQLNDNKIMVPTNKVMKLRLAMAEDGLPSSGSVGYELFDQTDAIGTTSFVQNINNLRALEGEIARTIRTIKVVTAARVHLVLPDRKLFSDENIMPSASIMISGGMLDPAQVRAIQQLTAAAVPDLVANRVSIVDDRGNLLAAATQSADSYSSIDGATDARLYQERLRQQLEDLIGASVGRDHVRAEVSVVLDAAKVTTQIDSFDPDSQVIRSSQNVTDVSRNNDNANQPVSVQSNLPASGQNQGGTANSQSQRNEETINYEISHTQKTMIQEAGSIKKLSVALLIDGTWQVNDKGGRVYSARNQSELDTIAALVKSAIGFDQARGDTVYVNTLPFSDDLLIMKQEQKTLKILGLNKDDILWLIKMLSLCLTVVLIVIFGVRPILNRLLIAIPMNNTQEMLINNSDNVLVQDGQSPGLSDEKSVLSNIERLGKIIENNPQAAIAVIRRWLRQ